MVNSRPGDDERQKSDDALGAGIMKNDYWLQNKIFTAEQWAQGTDADLLDGSAWRGFAERIARLGESSRSGLEANSSSC